ncbi:MAG: nucleoside monophosphate kinase [Patescibacteria group bacterium]|jgi:adenylate kinase
MKHIILLGPQGSGKGTQAQLLKRKFRLAHIEMGAILRAAAGKPTPLGKRIHRIINTQGALLPDKLVNALLENAVRGVAQQRGIVFDGFPRTIQQAKTLNVILKKYGRVLTHVIYMPLSQRTTVLRLSKRRTCTSCGTAWILGKNIASDRTKCPRCGGLVIQRKDDTPTIIRKRLREYLHKTLPIVSWYKKMDIVMEVNGEQSVRTVWGHILRHL